MRNLLKSPTIEPAGDRAIRISFGNEIDLSINQKVHTLAGLLEHADDLEIEDMVPAFTNLLIIFRQTFIDYAQLAAQLKEISLQITSENLSNPVTKIIPVLYGDEAGPDLERLAVQAGLTIEEFISRHTQSTYTIYMMGFTPGFPYLGGLDPSLAAPRLKTPRTAVPAGSVGIAGSQTGIYPIESPGGWNIIGRTPLTLFDPAADPPFLLKPGEQVRFKPVESAHRPPGGASE